MSTAFTNCKDFFILFAQFIGLVISFKVISKRLVKLRPKKMTVKPSAKIMFNALAPIIIETETPQVFEILNVSRLLNAFLCFNWNNSQSLPNFQQHFCNPSFDSGIVICILCLKSSFPPFCCG